MAIAEEEGMMILLAFEGMEQLWRTEVSGLLRVLIWYVSHVAYRVTQLVDKNLPLI